MSYERKKIKLILPLYFQRHRLTININMHLKCGSFVVLTQIAVKFATLKEATSNRNKRSNNK